MNGMERPTWNQDLTGATRRIVETDHSPLRVLAGPGTGKTFALTRRAARLLDVGVAPDQILVCTFTRTAARDLQKELSRLGIDGVDPAPVGTLHSFCFGLLWRADVLTLTQRVPRPLLTFEEDHFLVEDLPRERFGTIHERRRRVEAFNAAWARLQTDEPGWPNDPIDQEFQQDLLDWLRIHRAMLIGEIVPVTLRYLRENPASDEWPRFAHVLVDEFQDLNRAEQELITLLSSTGALAVVGDEDQSIYSFKYARPEGIADFDSSHPGTRDEGLDECRRCPRLVVEMANSLIANNVARMPRVITPLAENPHGEVLVVQWRSMEEEIQGIAQFIEQRVKGSEVDPGEVLVLAPRRQLGYAIRDALNNQGVLAHSFFHEEALDGNPKLPPKCDAQQAFTLLTLLADPEDRVALRCWCGFGSPSLRSGAWAALRFHCESTGESPYSVLGRMESGEIKIPRVGSLLDRFRELRSGLGPLDGLTGQSLVEALFPVAEAWAHPFRTLAANIEGDEFDAAALREVLRIGITQPELPTDVDYVRVMSLHKSKGLSADLVVVVGCVEGLIPMVADDDPSAAQTRTVEEQRRLFYVATTRTRRTLVLSSVTRIPRDVAYHMRIKVRGGDRTHGNTIASRYLAELGSARPVTVLGDTILRQTAQ